MRSQRTFVGAAAMAVILDCQFSASPATAAAGEDGARGAAAQLERLAQRDEKSPSGPEPDPGGLPGFRPNAPSPPAARPMPETRGGPTMRSRGVAPADSTTGSPPTGSETKGETKKSSEPK